jgi:hypothetical protein
MFDGATFDAPRDEKRLAKQQKAVRELMIDGQWRTLGQIAAAVGSPEASVSARLRDLRKLTHGSHQVERRYVKRGLYEYRVLPPPPPKPPEPRDPTRIDFGRIATDVLVQYALRLTGKE